MALRVLLADESSTIKKVFQLALQDFAVEVRPVNIGVDVTAVAQSFKPDIVFADVLLQKKNGYEVCAELKQDPQLRGIPVVLMWSGFMELDEDKFQASQANAQLEKPFDVTALRKLVTDLVPRTQNQRLSQFLSFPKAQVEAERRAEVPPPLPKSDEDFTDVPMPKMKGAQNQTEKYRLNLKPEDLDPSSIAVDYTLPAETQPESPYKPNMLDADDGEDEFRLHVSKKAAPIASPVENVPAPRADATPKTRSAPIPPAENRKPAPIAAVEEVDLDMEMDAPAPASAMSPAKPAPVKPAPAANMQAGATSSLSVEQLEKIIREQSAEVIESVVWKVIPELATQIIERELSRLLKERDSHPF